MVGLGLPWLLYTSFGTGFEPYHGLEAEGILESIIILACVLLVFVVLMLQTGFVIYKWHGNLFIALYFAYIALAIGQVYL
jgi:Ca2+/Na+ antiporter